MVQLTLKEIADKLGVKPLSEQERALLPPLPTSLQNQNVHKMTLAEMAEKAGVKPLKPIIPRNIFEKIGDVAGSILDPISRFTSGSFSKVAGTGIFKGAEKIGILGKVVGEKTADKIIQNLSPVTKTEIATAVLEAPYGLGTVAKVLSKIPGAKQLGGKIAESAVKSYSDLLNATTKITKGLTRKIAPEMVEKGIVVTSKKGLQELAEKNIVKYGQEIGEAFENLPEGSKLEIKPIIDRLQSIKNDYSVKGLAVEPKAVKAVDDMQKMFLSITEKSGDTAMDVADLRKIRQIFDKVVAPKGAFLQTDLKQFSDLARKEASNTIRGILADNYPNIAKLNKEFTFWKNVDEVISATILRQTGQKGALNKVLSGMVAAGGLSTGGVSGGLGAYGVMRILTNFVDTGIWKTLTGQAKKQIADALIEGKIGNIYGVLAKVGATSKEVISPQPKSIFKTTKK